MHPNVVKAMNERARAIAEAWRDPKPISSDDQRRTQKLESKYRKIGKVPVEKKYSWRSVTKNPQRPYRVGYDQKLPSYKKWLISNEEFEGTLENDDI